MCKISEKVKRLLIVSCDIGECGGESTPEDTPNRDSGSSGGERTSIGSGREGVCTK